MNLILPTTYRNEEALQASSDRTMAKVDAQSVRSLVLEASHVLMKLQLALKTARHAMLVQVERERICGAVALHLVRILDDLSKSSAFPTNRMDVACSNGFQPQCSHLLGSTPVLRLLHRVVIMGDIRPPCTAPRDAEAFRCRSRCCN